MGFWDKLFGKGTDGINQESISRDQMDLLWVDISALNILKATTGKGQVTHTVPDDQGGLRELQVTAEDIDWAERVNKLAEKASNASNCKNYTEAIGFYRKALRMAPGCDLYLMRIACCYANLGQPQKGIKYIERAAQISPENKRIQSNLVTLRKMI